MDGNIAQVLANIIVGVVVGSISAWVAGSLGVRHGVERAKRERAFDRRLDWYEQTFKAFNKFILKLNDVVPPPPLPDELGRVVTEFAAAAVEARNCVDTAPVYAERKTLIEMRRLFVELGRSRNLLSGQQKIETSDLVIKKNAIADIASGITCELAMSIRNQLGLDEITKEEFKWEKSS